MKKNLAIFSAILIISVLAISIVSAGWLSTTGNAIRDFFGKKDITQQKEKEFSDSDSKLHDYCFYSDGGMVYDVKGVVKVKGYSEEDRCYIDTWGEVIQVPLYENYCQWDDEGRAFIATEWHLCEKGCYDGACTDRPRSF